MATESWVLIALLYLWLAGACVVFFLWARMTRSLLSSMASLAATTETVLAASERFTHSLAHLMDMSADTLQAVTRQLLVQEINPLLDEDEKFKMD
jgi:hypothetical protein